MRQPDLCRCRGTIPGEAPRKRCPIVLAWMDGKQHDVPRYRCKLGLPYGPTTEADAFAAAGTNPPQVQP